MVADSRRVKELFGAAIELPEAGRAEYLDRECGDDAELRQRLVALLKAHDAPASALEQSLAGNCTADYTPISEKPGTMIGPYKLKEQIGEGGFGLVFVAEQQEPVKRKVALKVIKPGMDTREVMARFTAERQALALMDHPNIARVLDAGATESGRPYFVMELVRGIPITDYCDQNQLSPRDRLDLFITVCQAVQHAHQKGIIHRDVKPSNVLVTSLDGKPVAKVIDFGVAKAIHQQLTDRSIYTGFAQMVGTPLYMSPEQAEMGGLDIDTRSDIYSLGVLLYELLTGTTPLDKKRFARAAYDEIRRVIREVEPQKPSTRLSSSDSIASIAAQRHTEPAKLSKLIRGDLDWITMKALEKDRTRRYETANGLARDIQRYLSDEPVEAGPPSAAYKVKKFVQRNRTAVVAATTVSTLLLAITTFAILQASLTARFARTTQAALEGAVRANNAEVEQRQRAEAAAGAEKQAKEIAQVRESETKAVLDFVENKILAAARPEGQRGGLGHDVTLRRAIEVARPFVHENFAQQPLVEARLRMTLGNSYQFLGDDKIAAEEMEVARSLFTRYLGPDQRDTLMCMYYLATIFKALGRYADAMKLHQETLALRKAKLGPDDPDTWMSLDGLASVYSDVGRGEEALKLYEEVLALRTAKLGPDDPLTLGTMTNKALTYQRMGRPIEAVRLMEESLALHKARLGPDHPQTLLTMINLGACYWAIGRRADATRLAEGTLAIQRIKLGPDHPDTLLSMMNLAVTYADLGRLSDAAKLREETLTLQRVKLGPDHPEALRNMHDLTQVYTALGRHADALKLRDEAFALNNAKLGRNHSDTLWSMLHLAEGYTALGRQSEAMKLYEGVVERYRETVNAGGPVNDAAIKCAAASYWSLGRRKEAAACWAKAQALAPADTSILLTATYACLDAGDSAQYAAICRQALAQFADTNDPTAAERVAKVCLLAPPPPGDLPRIIALADIAVTRGKDEEGYRYFLLARGLAAYRAGDWAAALDWCGRSREQRPEIGEVVALNLLIEAMAHHQLGRAEPARAALADAAPLIDGHRDEFPGAGRPVAQEWLICEIVRKEAAALIKH
jgi:eukaryotic-like serine/threonine-protein kinase